MICLIFIFLSVDGQTARQVQVETGSIDLTVTPREVSLLTPAVPILQQPQESYMKPC